MKLIKRLFDISDNAQRPLNRTPKIATYGRNLSGYPIISDEEGFESNKKLIDELYTVSGVSPDQFEVIYKSVIRNLIQYIQLLPASENHHHSHVGGLLTHSLEVGLYSLKQAQSIYFSDRAYADVSRKQEPIWRYGAWLTGLLHDIGKPLIDIRVTSIDFNHVWPAYSMSLYEWARSLKLNEYTYEFVSTRIHNEHISQTEVLFLKIIGKAGTDYLQSQGSGPEIIKQVIYSLTMKSNGRFTPLLKNAEDKSVNTYVEHMGNLLVSHAKTPKYQHIIEALRALYADPATKHMFFATRVGMGIMWPETIKLAINYLNSREILVPQVPEKIADALYEMNFIDSFNGLYVQKIWDPHQKKDFPVLRWTSPQHIYEKREPVIGPYVWESDLKESQAYILNEDNESNSDSDPATQDDSDIESKSENETAGLLSSTPENAESEGEIRAERQTTVDLVNIPKISPVDEQPQVDTDSPSPSHATNNTESPRTHKNTQQTASPKPVQTKLNTPSLKKAPAPQNSSHSKNTPVKKPTADIAVNLKPLSNESSKSSPIKSSSDNPVSKSSQANNPSTPQKGGSKPQQSASTSADKKQKRALAIASPYYEKLMAMGAHGVILATLSNDLYNNKRTEMVYWDHGELAIEFPEGLAGYGRDTANILHELREFHCLARHELLTKDNKNYLLLNTTLSKMVSRLPLLEEICMPSSPHTIEEAIFRILNENLIKDYGVSKVIDGCLWFDRRKTITLVTKLLEKKYLSSKPNVIDPDYAKAIINNFKKKTLIHENEFYVGQIEYKHGK